MKSFLSRVIAIACTLSFIHSAALASNGTQLRDLLNKHFEAMGGASNWHTVESIRLNGTVARDGQTVAICIVKKRPNQIRATITIPFPGDPEKELQMIQAHDGSAAWTATRLAGAPEMTKEALPPEAAAELLADAGVLPQAIKLWRQGAKLALHPPVYMDGQSFFFISAESETAAIRQEFYLSTDDYRMHKIVTHSPNDSVTTQFDQYEPYNGIFIPMLTSIESTKTGKSLIKIDSAMIGLGIYEDYFSMDPDLTTASYQESKLQR